MADFLSATLCCISLESLNSTRTSGGLQSLPSRGLNNVEKLDNGTGCHSSETLLIGAGSREKGGIPLSAVCTVHMTFDGRNADCSAD